MERKLVKELHRIALADYVSRAKSNGELMKVLLALKNVNVKKGSNRDKEVIEQ